VGAPWRQREEIAFLVLEHGELLALEVDHPAVSGREVIHRAVHRLGDQDVGGGIVSDLVRNGAQEEPPGPGHALVSHHDQVDVRVLGDLDEDVGRLALRHQRLDLHALRPALGRVLQGNGPDDRIAHVHQGDGGAEQHGQLEGLSGRLAGRGGSVGPGQEPLVAEVGPFDAVGPRGIDDEEIAGGEVGDPVRNAAELEPGGLPHPLVPHHDEVGVLALGGVQDHLRRIRLADLAGRFHLLARRRVERPSDDVLRYLSVHPWRLVGAHHVQSGAEPLG
jgi:hypothetical protein